MDCVLKQEDGGVCHHMVSSTSLYPGGGIARTFTAPPTGQIIALFCKYVLFGYIVYAMQDSLIRLYIRKLCIFYTSLFILIYLCMFYVKML